jgi:hypothetical protein
VAHYLVGARRFKTKAAAKKHARKAGGCIEKVTKRERVTLECHGVGLRGDVVPVDFRRRRRLDPRREAMRARMNELANRNDHEEIRNLVQRDPMAREVFIELMNEASARAPLPPRRGGARVLDFPPKKPRAMRGLRALPAGAPEPMLLIDDEHETTLREFLEANQSAPGGLTRGEVSRIKKLNVGESYHGGGGAWADWKVTRTRGLGNCGCSTMQPIR